MVSTPRCSEGEVRRLLRLVGLEVVPYRDARGGEYADAWVIPCLACGAQTATITLRETGDLFFFCPVCDASKDRRGRLTYPVVDFLEAYAPADNASGLRGRRALMPTTSAPGTWADLAGALGPIEWVWDGWLAAGFLTMLAAGLEMGKSNLCLRIAGCFLRSDRWPGGTPCALSPSKVLWCETEAAQAMNLDRARRWGLPLDRIVTPFADPLADVDLDNSSHRQAITNAATRDDVGLIIVDSLSGRSARDERGAAFGEVTGWLASVARDAGTPAITNHHLRKRGPRDPDPRREVTLEMIRGSTAVLQTTRIIWALDQPEPTSPWRRLHVIKNNLAKPPGPVGMLIAGDGRVVFGPSPGTPHSDTAEEQACRFLCDLLSDGPVPSEVVWRRADEEHLAPATVNRAKRKLGISSVKPDGVWHWALSGQRE
jgi:putative DNA primase/helicase